MGLTFFIENIFLGVGLAMDAFSVSLVNGISEPCMKKKKIFLIAFVFALFQALMPLIGYFLGSQFERFIVNVDHWIAFVLLGLIGFNMIKEARECEELDDSFSVKTMLPLAIATSIDALAVGITFAVIKADIAPAVTLIGTITFSLSIVGIKIGNVFGARFKSKAEICGGVLLIGMGLKILIEHLFL